MRESRNAINRDFWPKSFADVLAVTKADHPLNAPWRQTTTYWEMVYGTVKHGIVNADYFMESNGEGLFLFARVAPYLEELAASYLLMPFRTRNGWRRTRSSARRPSRCFRPASRRSSRRNNARDAGAHLSGRSICFILASLSHPGRERHSTLGPLRRSNHEDGKWQPDTPPPPRRYVRAALRWSCSVGHAGHRVAQRPSLLLRRGGVSGIVHHGDEAADLWSKTRHIIDQKKPAFIRRQGRGHFSVTIQTSASVTRRE